MFRVGNKLECIYSKEALLTKRKVYVAELVWANRVQVTNDAGEQVIYSNRRFEEIVKKYLGEDA